MKMKLMLFGILPDWTKKKPEKDTSNGFPGEYKITYFDPDGNDTGTFDLKIIKSGLVHELFWSLDGEVIFVGVGIETSDGFSAGWRKAQ